MYSYGPESTFESMSVQAVADVIEQLENYRITVTGGEPLLQEPAIIELIDELTRRNARYDFNIETNGTIIPRFHRDNVWFTYDYKTPSSLAEDAMNLDIFKQLPAISLNSSWFMQDLDRMWILKHILRMRRFVSPVGQY
ncbi:MAG: hypothetical protein ACLRZ2_06165 [Veillonella sp.]